MFFSFTKKLKISFLVSLIPGYTWPFANTLEFDYVQMSERKMLHA